MTRFNPLDYPISLTRPERIAPSTWLTHTPFAMFLVDILRPSLIVELGTQYGVSYCAFCQAVQILKLNTRCYAVDTWEGDAHVGEYGSEVIKDLRHHHDPRYSEFSQLLQSTFDEALKNFENKTIDLLHIDGYHSYEEVRNDFLNWLPKMSKRGVILFHDIHVRDIGFGVWKLWGELKKQYPYFDFPHGYGLGVLVVGKQYPPQMNLLLKVTNDLTIIKDFFFQLGVRVQNEYTLYNLTKQVEEQEHEIKMIHNSNSWKFISFLQRIRLFVLPVNSTRERLAQTLLKGIENVLRES
jgi:hypothetical protein